jgi:hypothetical protein
MTSTKTTKAEAAASTAAPPLKLMPAAKGKLGILLTLLQREEGATIFDMAEATGWQFHSVRGAMAGSIKKKLGLTITSAKPGNERIYRIIAAPRSGGEAEG